MRQILHPTTRYLNFRQPALQFLCKRRQKFARHQTVSPRQRLRQHPRNRAVARARLDKQRTAAEVIARPSILEDGKMLPTLRGLRA